MEWAPDSFAVLSRDSRTIVDDSDPDFAPGKILAAENFDPRLLDRMGSESVQGIRNQILEYAPKFLEVAANQAFTVEIDPEIDASILCAIPHPLSRRDRRRFECEQLQPWLFVACVTQ
jgi:hypothetical protein